MANLCTKTFFFLFPTDEETDGFDGEDEVKKPIYLFESLTALCPWMPRLSLPGSFRISPGRLKKKLVQLWRNRKTYDDRILVVGNKFSEHLFRELNIDLKKVQTGFGTNKKANKFCTSKYTLLTFVPLNLYEQFRRTANIYFLLSLLFAFIFQKITPVSPNR